jgi:hypothetical protein
MYWKETNKKNNAEDLIKEVENVSRMQRQRMKNQIQDNPHVNEMGDLLEWNN